MIDLVEACKKYLGLAPYDGWTNPCIFDSYYIATVREIYGDEVVNKTLKKLES